MDFVIIMKFVATHPAFSFHPPMFLISIPALQRNTAILREVADQAGCKVVLALKGFSCWKAFPHITKDLDGCCASGLWEGMLAREHFKSTSSPIRPLMTKTISTNC